jgi:histidinol-phosphate aminotransferase
MCGAEVVALDYKANENGPFLSPDTVTHAIRARKPKLVCLPNPDSPTGTAFDPGALRIIVETALTAGAAVLIDEAYYPFYPHSAVPWISECPNVIVARTFSKAWGLAGLRLGYGVGAPETISLLHKVRPNYEVNMVAVALAVRMITDFEHEMKASVRRLNAGRDYFLSAMRELGLRTYSSEASFCHVAFDGHAEALHAALSKVVLYRKDSDAPCLAGFSRFSATTVELIEPVIDCVRRVV